MEKTVVSYKDCIEKSSKVSIWSVDWANRVLVDGIKELKNTDRDCDARICEVLVRIKLLRRRGFWWQSDRLKNHLHRFYKDPGIFLQTPKEFDPLTRARGYSP